MMSGIDCRTMKSFRIAESPELVCKISAIMNRGFDFQMSKLGHNSYLINAMNYARRNWTCAGIWLLIYNDLNRDRRDSFAYLFSPLSLEFLPWSEKVFQLAIIYLWMLRCGPTSETQCWKLGNDTWKCNYTQI